MRIKDIVKLSLNNIVHRRLRSVLTVLGIVIGIATVIALVSIGQGFQESINSQLSQLGGNILIVRAGHERAGGGFSFGGAGRQDSTTSQSLTENDVNSIRSVAGVEVATGVVSGNARISFSGQNASSSITGIEPGPWESTQQVILSSGRFLRQSDTGSVVIGSRTASGLFKKNITLNSRIMIDGKTFVVVGILQQTGGLASGFNDNSVIVLKNTARSLLGESSPDDASNPNDVSMILLKVSQSANTSQVTSSVEQRLLITRRVTQQNEDFTITSSETIQQNINNIAGTTTFFLGGIAAISLLVGGIGVANTMFTSVVERTRHIGVLKSLGATDGEIMKLFLFESAFMGLIGGLIGTMLGILVSGVISQVGGLGGSIPMARGPFGATTYVSPEVIIFAITFSMFIGAISGLLPAKRAAEMSPVEALRYE